MPLDLLPPEVLIADLIIAVVIVTIVIAVSTYRSRTGAGTVVRVGRPDPSSPAGLGSILWRFGRSSVCEAGVGNRHSAIVWDDVVRVYVSSHKTIQKDRRGRYLATSWANRELRVQGGRGAHGEVKLTLWRPGDLPADQVEEFRRTRDYVISRIMDRQWRSLQETLRWRERVSFGTVDVLPTAICPRRLLGRVDRISNDCLTDITVQGDRLCVTYRDPATGVPRTVALGKLSRIANLHLLLRYLDSLLFTGDS